MTENRIIYILIAKDKTPLCGYSEHTGDFVQMCENMLGQVKNESSAAINLGTGYVVFYINEAGITYMLMTTAIFPKSTAVGCIESIQKEFQSTYIGKDFNKISDYCLDKEFKDKLKMKYEFFNENSEVSSEHIQQLKDAMLKMKDEVLEASELLNLRGSELSSMAIKAEALAQDSEELRRHATKVKKTESNRKCYITIAIVAFALFIAFFIFVIICGNFTFEC